MLRNSLIVSVLLPVLVGAQCGRGAIYDSDRRKCFHYQNATVDYHTAESICAAFEGYLISVHSDNDIVYFSEEVQKNIQADSSVWMGAEVYSPSSWRWADGSPVDFQAADPNNDTSSSNCFHLLQNSSKWLTTDCTNKLPFVCAYSASSTCQATCSPQIVNLCPSGYAWFDLTDYCYKVVVEPAMFSVANAACQREGSQLASIHLSNENNFLVELSETGLNYTDGGHRQDVWIGLIFADNVWKWTDGTAVDYLNWAAGEPNHMTGEFWTTLMPDPYHSDYNPNGGQWNNINNVTQIAYICKRSPNL